MIEYRAIPYIIPGTTIASKARAVLFCGCCIWVGNNLDDGDLTTVTQACCIEHGHFAKLVHAAFADTLGKPEYGERQAVDVANEILNHTAYGYANRN